MIISRTPFRISFFGGGTDYPEWYLKHGGKVLSTTIDKYCYITFRFRPPYFGEKHRVVWSHIELVDQVSEILHPAVKEGLRFLGFDESRGCEIHHQADLPARSGMGSSSAFAVGLINALTWAQGKKSTREGLAEKAIQLEHERLKENVGSQDQFATAFGGLNLIHFERDGKICVEPIKISPERKQELNSRLILVYSGSTRLSSEVAGHLVSQIKDREKTLHQLAGLVDEGAAILGSDSPIDEFGELLNKTWELKRELNPSASNGRIDSIYKRAMDAGALGGKLLGAGGAGFFCFFVRPEDRYKLQEALSDLVCVPFSFEESGSQVIYDEGSNFDSVLAPTQRTPYSFTDSIPRYSM